MTTALPSAEPTTEPGDVATTITSTARSSWYDPDASAWEPQPPSLFEALKASPARPSVALKQEPSTERPRRP